MSIQLQHPLHDFGGDRATAVGARQCRERRLFWSGRLGVGYLEWALSKSSAVLVSCRRRLVPQQISQKSGLGTAVATRENKARESERAWVSFTRWRLRGTNPNPFFIKAALQAAELNVCELESKLYFGNTSKIFNTAKGFLPCWHVFWVVFFLPLNDFSALAASLLFHCISFLLSLYPSTSVSRLFHLPVIAARVLACSFRFLSVTTYGICRARVCALLCSPPDCARQPSQSRDLSKGGCPGFLCKKDEGCAGDGTCLAFRGREERKKNACGIGGKRANLIWGWSAPCL